jgi:xanthine/uracil/vitamin C permease (AzgA family)
MSTIAATLRGEGLLERYFGFTARGTTFARKKAIAIGIGLFIAFIGLYNSGIIASDPSSGTPVQLGSFTTWPIFVAIFGLAFTFVLRAIRFRGDLLVGIVGTTVVATIINSATNHSAFGTSTATWPGWHNLYAKPTSASSATSACTRSRQAS